MKKEKPILFIISFSFLAVAIFASYNTPLKDIDNPDGEYLTDIENYKKKASDKIAVNYRNMTEFRARLVIEESKTREDFAYAISKYEQKTNELKIRLSEYRVSEKNEWESFKRKFDRDLNELHQWFAQLTIKMSNNHDNNLSPRFAKP
jgi:hypothetical protein